MTLDPYSPGCGKFNFRPYRNAFMFLGVNRTWETEVVMSHYCPSSEGTLDVQKSLLPGQS